MKMQWCFYYSIYCSFRLSLCQSRPFGVALLIGGVDELGPALYHTDPSGTFLRYDAKAIGAGSENAQSKLEEEYHKVRSLHSFLVLTCQSMTLDEAKVLALQILKQVMEEKIRGYNVEVGVIAATDKQFKLLSEDEISKLIAELKPSEEEAAAST